MSAIADQKTSLLTRDRWIEIGRILVCGAIIGIYAAGYAPVWALWTAVVIGLYPLVTTGVRDLVKERKIGTEIFVTIATLIAVFGGEAVAGAVLMVIILIAEFIADFNTDRARASIRKLLGAAPMTATVRGASGDRTVPATDVKVDDVVLVKAGEKIPVDGEVTSGEGAVSEASITGESVPVEKTVGSQVFAGTLVESGALDIRTQKVGQDTTFARIVKLVEEAEESEAPVQKLADRVAGWLIPVVFVFLIIVYAFTRDVRMIVTLLIFTSPAELGLATPMVMIAAIARAAREGILVKGGIFLETFAKVDVLAFDKTGTLTVGKPAVEGVEVADVVVSETDFIRLAASANRRSGHPLAGAILDHASNRKVALSEPSAFTVIQGRGVEATVEGRQILIGNQALMEERGVSSMARVDDGRSRVYVAIDGQRAGAFVVADQLRPGARAAIEQLRATGIKRIVMLTGDSKATADRVAAELGIEAFADLLPQDKLDIISKLQEGGHLVAMVGDGVNDAPALAKANVGIAMGAGGTDAALEAADIALMTGDLSKIATARAIAKAAYRTIQQNLFVGVGVVHVLGITAALLRMIGPIQAAVIHLGPDVLVFLNSIKLLRIRITLPKPPQSS